ncbi:MAG TPA: flagellar biosynthesis protein FlhB [Pseudolabrys sp.]
MADGDDSDKSEEPTQKRLDEALERGDVVKSQEVNTWFVIAGGTLVLSTFGTSMSDSLMTTMRGLVANAHSIRVDGPALPSLFQKIGLEMLAAVAVPFLVLMVAAAAGNFVQHRLVWTYDGITPKWSKVSPMAGMKRLFSKQALANLAKGIVKLILLGSVLTAMMWPEWGRLEGLERTDPAAIMPLTLVLSMKLMGAVVAMLAVVAGADFLFQYRDWWGRQRMSLQEIKEEFRNSEGDPHVKGKIKQLRASKQRRRMMQKVPKAAVIITNPTHYAIALEYERGMEAPICVAKGMDAVALKIREIGTEHGVPIVENPPLARALHATVEIDDPIPPEHYKAVAEVIGYVMKMRRALAR